MYKKRDARAKLLFYFNKPIGFLDVLVTVASLNLKVPINVLAGKCDSRRYFTTSVFSVLKIREKNNFKSNLFLVVVLVLFNQKDFLLISN